MYHPLHPPQSPPNDSIPPDLLQSELVFEQQHGPAIGILDGHRVEHPTSCLYRRPATNNPSKLHILTQLGSFVVQKKTSHVQIWVHLDENINHLAMEKGRASNVVSTPYSLSIRYWTTW